MIWKVINKLAPYVLHNIVICKLLLNPENARKDSITELEIECVNSNKLRPNSKVSPAYKPTMSEVLLSGAFEKIA